MPPMDAKHISDEQLRNMHGYLASLAEGPAAKDIPMLRALMP